ncbi:transcription factor [Grosmannia clavigera kw1407]|uniref:Transcription factor n=1 Tax=Grosmannia clavigera (strain kw1407 / UAMH 11150) TaxID=655863 RepID=F0XBQ3_GROCL|nr:transcription factor [Grosmannia clavigera kw1407]EFX04985.1 transcription factor [Grosmannia clavigera kw1407]
MAGRPPPPRGNGSAYAPNPASRTNEYFVPRDGIDREVITADICRYLGNDALVRPGNYTNPDGYYITAYRNLTSAMITDLKNDSARWEAERRRQSGSGAVAVRYQDSHIRDGPQRAVGGNVGHGVPAYGGPPREYDNGPRYPEGDGLGYNTGAGPGAPPYGGPGGYPVGYSQPPPPPSFPAPMHTGMPDSRFGPPTGPVPSHGGNYVNAGNNGAMGAPEGYSVGSYYQASSSRDVYSQDMAMDDVSNVPIRRTSPNSNPGFGGNPGTNFRRPFPNVPGGAGGNYGAYPPPPNGHGVAFAQPVDNNYGRAPNMPTQGFSNPHDFPIQQPQQYEDPAYPSSPSRPGSTPSTKTQLPSPSEPPTGPRRDGERAGSDRPEYRDRGMSERDHRDTTPPNKAGLANKPGPPGQHHYPRR